jgi:hypothetical protein
MVEGLLLVDARTDVRESLRSKSLANAKQLVLGRLGPGTVLHVAATGADDLRQAILEFATVDGVTGVMAVAIREV